MQNSRCGIMAWLLGALVLGGCRQDEPQAAAETAAMPMDTAATARAELEQELRDVHTEILERVDSVGEVLETVPMLTRQERAALRRDLNAEQIARARALGVRASGEREIETLRRDGRLVPLEDSTRYWIVRELDYSVPYVTPDAKVMLTEIGRRFHSRLDSLGIPPYRIEVTSVLRTPETQADLRQSNSNASQGVSAHEFGTTVDLSRVGFTAPDPSTLPVEVSSAPSLTPQLQQMEAAALARAAEARSSALQAALGRVLVEMREENKLLVMMERQQAVYHITVATRF